MFTGLTGMDIIPSGFAFSYALNALYYIKIYPIKY